MPATTRPCPAARSAIERITSEHRALARIIAAMQVWIAQARNGRDELDLDLFEAMLRYIEEVPDRVHHPREDDTLFPAVSSVSGGNDILGELQREHACSEAMLSDVRRAYTQFDSGGPNALNGLSTAVDEFAEFYWAHMRKEEDRLLPFAAASLTEAQWESVDAAFAQNTDPLFGSALTEKYRRLYDFIVAQTAEPLKGYIAVAAPSA